MYRVKLYFPLICFLSIYVIVNQSNFENTNFTFAPKTCAKLFWSNLYKELSFRGLQWFEIDWNFHNQLEDCADDDNDDDKESVDDDDNEMIIM